MDFDADALLAPFRSQDSSKNGWLMCQSSEDFDCQSALSAVLEHVEHPNLDERETLYRRPPFSATVKLLWVEGNPAGFYILRAKGLQQEGSYLHMPIMDGIFIRKPYRRKGWAAAMLDDIVQMYPAGDIGFSQPVSDSMWAVLKSYLAKNPRHRQRFWLVEGCAEEGDRLNVWFSLALRNKR